MRGIILSLVLTAVATATPTTINYAIADFNAGPVLFTAQAPTGSFDVELNASAVLSGIWIASLTGHQVSGTIDVNLPIHLNGALFGIPTSITTFSSSAYFQLMGGFVVPGTPDGLRVVLAGMGILGPDFDRPVSRPLFLSAQLIVPEPNTLGLLGIPLLALGIAARRRL